MALPRSAADLRALAIGTSLVLSMLAFVGTGFVTGSPSTYATPAATTLLASLNYSGSGWARGVYPSLGLTFSVSSDFMAPGSVIGDNIRHRTNETGSFDFTPANETDFGRVATLLTNGRDDFITLSAWINGGGSEGSPESNRLGGNPDLVTYSVGLVRLVIHVISIYPEGEGTRYQHASTWEMWGHPLEVAYVPPTDPDGTIVIDRTYTEVAASLRVSGIAVLEWDGMNESMVHAGGAVWSLNKTGIANGAHTFRVWANDTGGTWYATELRTILVQAGWWRTERIAYGFMPSLAHDADGVPHLCYYDGDFLAYANGRTRAWQTVVVDPGVHAGQHCSIALDSAGRPHVSYQDASTFSGIRSLRYAHDDGTGWVTEWIEEVGFTTDTAIAINPVSGEPWIGYYDTDTRDLKLARRSGGAWSTEIVDGGGDVGGAPTLAFDSVGAAGMTYVHFDTLSLRYAVGVPGTWQLETIETGGIGGWDNGFALQFDSQDVPHAAYAHVGGLRYAVRNGTTWDIEVLDATPVSAVAMDLDALDRPRVAYLHSYGPRVLYSAKDVAWNRELVQMNASGQGIAFELTPKGTPAIVHPGRDAYGDLAYSVRAKRAPIQIHSDADFTEANGVVGGAGTPADPFVIAGWHVDTLSGSGVHVRDTSAPFVLRDVSVRSGRGATTDGILLEGVQGARVTASRLSDNGYGIRVVGSANVEVLGNEIASNGVGLVLEGSAGVQVASNRFESNDRQASDDQGSVNAWDSGYPYGGNFWSDYVGLDRCEGPSQDMCTGPDGIGDEPYVIDADSRDHYPLVAPNEIPVPSFTMPPTNLYVGEPVRFDASGSMDPDGSIVMYAWDFGDGTAGSGVVVTHLYPAAGTYRVALTVVDNRAVSASTSRTITILAVSSLPLSTYTHASGFRLPIPVGWEVREDQVIEGTTVELLVLGPVAFGVQTNILVDTDVDPTVREDSAWVDALANETLDAMRSEDPSLEVIEAPQRRPIAGAAGFIVTVRYPTLSLYQKAAVVVSDEHDRYWLLLLTVDVVRYRELNATFEAMLDGFEITLPAPGELSVLELLPFILIGILGGAVAVAVVVGVLLVRRGSRPMPRHVSSPRSAAESSRAPARSVRFCPHCGAPVLVGSRFCVRCGATLP